MNDSLHSPISYIHRRIQPFSSGADLILRSKESSNIFLRGRSTFFASGTKETQARKLFA